MWSVDFMFKKKYSGYAKGEKSHIKYSINQNRTEEEEYKIYKYQINEHKTL